MGILDNNLAVDFMKVNEACVAESQESCPIINIERLLRP
jgi:hypothetical protein